MERDRVKRENENKKNKKKRKIIRSYKSKRNKSKQSNHTNFLFSNCFTSDSTKGSRGQLDREHHTNTLRRSQNVHIGTRTSQPDGGGVGHRGRRRKCYLVRTAVQIENRQPKRDSKILISNHMKDGNKRFKFLEK